MKHLAIFQSRISNTSHQRPDALLSPDGIAETYQHLHTQNRSSWAFDVDLRPWVENLKKALRACTVFANGRSDSKDPARAHHAIER
ncbi:MAG: hypothetical protein VYE58_01860 [Pseudomonadota bacterium]|nr:hypothetical protein [Pseudomonadota bacterium]